MSPREDDTAPRAANEPMKLAGPPATRRVYRVTFIGRLSGDAWAEVLAQCLVALSADDEEAHVDPARRASAA